MNCIYLLPHISRLVDVEKTVELCVDPERKVRRIQNETLIYLAITSMQSPNSIPKELAKEASTLMKIFALMKDGQSLEKNLRKKTKLGKLRCDVGMRLLAEQKLTYSSTRMIACLCSFLTTCFIVAEAVEMTTPQGSHTPASPSSTCPNMPAICCLETRWMSSLACDSFTSLRLPALSSPRLVVEVQEEQEILQVVDNCSSAK